MRAATRHSIRVADEVWLATALLHRENPGRSDFTVSEIVDRARKEGIAGDLRPGVYVHALQHCVANRAPSPARYRMLYATGKLKRRLFYKGDSYHPARDGAKITPACDEIPSEYVYLLDWYSSNYAAPQSKASAENSILELRGLGREIWEGVDPDEYVRKLREGWE
jgi:hypothetical protein